MFSNAFPAARKPPPFEELLKLGRLQAFTWHLEAEDKVSFSFLQIERLSISPKDVFRQQVLIHT